MAVLIIASNSIEYAAFAYTTINGGDGCIISLAIFVENDVIISSNVTVIPGV